MNSTDAVHMQAAAFLEDEDSVSAVCGELGKRLFSALSGTQQHTKKRKREDEGEREGTVSSSRISCSVADQVRTIPIHDVEAFHPCVQYRILTCCTSYRLNSTAKMLHRCYI